MSNYNSTLQLNNTDLQAILNTVNELPNAGGSDPVLQDKTVTPTTSSQTIKADSGYDGLDTVTVNAMPTATQATPSITINSSGLITATATQTAGYVAAGTMSATKQLAFQAAKTITPTTASQIAVSSGYYTGGDITVAAIPSTYVKPSYTKTATTYTPKTTNQTISAGTYCSGVQTIKGDANLVAGNIKSGVSIFGVAGNYAGSGDTSMEDGLVTRAVTTYTNDRVTVVGSNAFYDCTRLTTINLPNAVSISSKAFYGCKWLTTINLPNVVSINGSYAFAFCHKMKTLNFPKLVEFDDWTFYACKSLTTVSFPAATSIGPSAFYSCSSLSSVSLPNAEHIGEYAFYSCYKLTTLSFPKASYLGGFAFGECVNLKSLYLTGSSVCKLAYSNIFTSTPIGGYSKSAGTYGSIYVPASLLASYKTATNWTYFSSRFVGI